MNSFKAYAEQQDSLFDNSLVDKITSMRVAHTAKTYPDNAMWLLWDEVWKIAVKKLDLNIRMPQHTPQSVWHQVDDYALKILQSVGVDAERKSKNKDSRRFLIKGQEVYHGGKNRDSEWSQD